MSATATALNTVVDELRRMPPFGDSEPVVRAVLAYYPTKLDEADVFKRELKYIKLEDPTTFSNMLYANSLVL